MKKKDYPLLVLKDLQQYLNFTDPSIRRVKEGNIAFFRDIDSSSDLFFHIQDVKMDGSRFLYFIQCKPSSNSSQELRQAWVESKSLKPELKTWLARVKEYDTLEDPNADPILDAYVDEYYSDFEISDQSAETAPLSIKHAFLLDGALESLSENISAHQKGNTKEVLEIQEDINSLREEITNISRSEVAKKLSRIFGKITKQGLKFLKDVLNEGRKEVIKGLIKHGYELTSAAIDSYI